MIHNSHIAIFLINKLMSASELVLHGLIDDMSNADYHAAPGISKSQLDMAAISPLAYYDAYVNPDREPREEKHCFAVGSGTHTIVLEPHLFESTYGVGFDKDAHAGALDTVADLRKEIDARGLMKTGAKPELVDRLIDDGFPPERIMMVLEKRHNDTIAGRTPIAAADYKNMLGMLRGVTNHHTAGGLIEGAYIEQSYFVTVTVREALGPYYERERHGDPDAPILLKIRADAITHDGRVMVDLKTTEDVSKKAFGVTIARRRYHVQGAFYLDVMAWLYGADAPETFCFIPAQKQRPYDVAVHWLNELHIAAGRDLYQQDLARIIACRRVNYWPGADGGRIIEAELPGWATAGAY